MINFGNKKIKDLYYNGKKIKEVYNGSSKVFGSVKIGYTRVGGSISGDIYTSTSMENYLLSLELPLKTETSWEIGCKIQWNNAMISTLCLGQPQKGSSEFNNYPCFTTFLNYICVITGPAMAGAVTIPDITLTAGSWYYLKLVRNGYSFIASASSDGINWSSANVTLDVSTFSNYIQVGGGFRSYTTRTSLSSWYCKINGSYYWKAV